MEDNRERDYKLLLIKFKQIREILEVKGIASNTKVSLIENIVKGDSDERI